MPIKDFLEKWKKTSKMPVQNPIFPISSPTVNATGAVTVTTTAPPVSVPNGILTSMPPWTMTTAANPSYINISGGSYGYTAPPANILTLSNSAGKEIVRMTQDGKIIWADPEMDEDAAAQAFTRSIMHSAELKSGITQKVKSNMRDMVFEEIINIAKQKGSLTADDLTYLLEASKIIEKLKGG